MTSAVNFNGIQELARIERQKEEAKIIEQQNSLSGSIFGASQKIGNTAAYATEVALAPVSLATGALGGILSGIFSALSPIFGLLGGLLTPFAGAVGQQPQQSQQFAPQTQGQQQPEDMSKIDSFLTTNNNTFKTGTNAATRNVSTVYTNRGQKLTLDTKGCEKLSVSVGAAVEEFNEAVKDLQGKDETDPKKVKEYCNRKMTAILKDIEGQRELLNKVDANSPYAQDINAAIEFLEGQKNILEEMQKDANNSTRVIAKSLLNNAKSAAEKAAGAKANEYNQYQNGQERDNKISTDAEFVKFANNVYDESEANSTVEIIDIDEEQSPADASAAKGANNPPNPADQSQGTPKDGKKADGADKKDATGTGNPPAVGADQKPADKKEESQVTAPAATNPENNESTNKTGNAVASADSTPKIQPTAVPAVKQDETPITKPMSGKEISEKINQIMLGNLPEDLDNKEIKDLMQLDRSKLTEEEKAVLNAYAEYQKELEYWNKRGKDLQDSNKFYKEYRQNKGRDGLTGIERLTTLGHDYYIAKLQNQKNKLNTAKQQTGLDPKLITEINNKIREIESKIAQENKDYNEEMKGIKQQQTPSKPSSPTGSSLSIFGSCCG